MELPCIIEYVRYNSGEGFGILSVSLNAYSSKYNVDLEAMVASHIKNNKYDTFTVATNMLDPEGNVQGQQCIFVGDFFNHPKYGPQFKAEFQYHDVPTTEEGLIACLMDLPNIKEARSLEMIKKFGVKGTIEILDTDPDRLTEINGITAARIAPIKEQWDKFAVTRELYFWLGEHGVGHKIGQKAFEKWDAEARDILEENPYKLTELRGVGFSQADMIAHKIKDKVPIDYRVHSCICFVLNQNLYKAQNLCMPYSKLKKEVINTLGESDSKLSRKPDDYLSHISKQIANNLEDFAIVRDMASEGQPTYIYLADIWKKEKYIAKRIFDRSKETRKKKTSTCSDEDIATAEEDVAKISGKAMTLDDCQKESVKSAFHNKITVITGGGGTGKSTICRCIYYLAQIKGLSVRMMSPTGKAAQVLADKTKGHAATIHRSLKMKPGDDFPNETITEDILILDEVSMVGIDTMFGVMVALDENPYCNVVFVGDSNQLPSVSPGNFLFDIVGSGCANVVKLNKIHRQSENSYISVLANDIAKGRAVENIPQEAEDIRWHNINPDSFSDILPKILTAYMSQHEMDELQVIASKYKGPCGVDKVNEVTQDLMSRLNGTEDYFLKTKFRTFHVKDRVIQTENNYDKSIYNGDMGHIVDLGKKVINPKVSDKKDDYVTVDFYGEEISFYGGEIQQLQLAWCITVHKYQGSQSPYVLFVMPDEAEIMMTKELVYTAFTRAEKYLSIYGSLRMLRKAPMNGSIKKRYTNMNRVILQLKTGKKVLNVKQHTPS